jgi:hypothetical protein
MKISNYRCSFLSLCILFFPVVVHAQQLKLGSAPTVIEKSALLDLNSDKQGLLLPRISDYTAAPLNAAPDGMLIYNVPDKLLYIRKNGIWRKLIDETNGVTSVNGQTGPAVTLTTNNITEAANLYYTDARARAAFSAGTGINISTGVISALNTNAIWNASQLQGRNIASTAPANDNVLTWDNASNSWIPKAPVATGGTVTAVGLSMPAIFTVTNSPVTTSGTLTATLNSQAQRLVFASPVTGAAAPTFRALDPLDIPALDAAKITTGVFPIARGGLGLSALGAVGQSIRVNPAGTGFEFYTPSASSATITLTGDVTGSGTTSIATTLANSGVTAGTYPKVTVDAKGRVTAGSALLPADIPASSTYYIQNISTGIQTASYAISGNGSVGGTFSLPTMNTGSILFAGATGVVSQKNANLFWDNTNNRLGLGTTTPSNTLEVAGTVAGTGVSGLRLKDLNTATVQAYNSKVLSINASGDVIVTANAAANNWLISGNSNVNAASQFLGTTDDNKMVIRSNNTPLLEFGRRQTLGLTEGYADYTDNDEMVTYMRSALQFAVPASVNFYKPKMWTTADGNFRVKGSSAGTDYFEFGATGTTNNGGFEFVIGDDGDEPIVFKSYNYTNTTFTEIMRLQNNNVGIGLGGATPLKRLHVNANNDALRVTNLAGSGTGNPLVIAANGDIRQTTELNGVAIGETTSASGSFTTLAVAVATINLGTTNNNINIGNASFIRIQGPNQAFTISGIDGGFDGRTVTLFNTTGNNMSIQNGNAGSLAENRIITMANTIATTGQGTVTLVYSAADSRWIVTAMNP